MDKCMKAMQQDVRSWARRDALRCLLIDVILVCLLLFWASQL